MQAIIRSRRSNASGGAVSSVLGGSSDGEESEEESALLLEEALTLDEFDEDFLELLTTAGEWDLVGVYVERLVTMGDLIHSQDSFKS